jgi:hypothetical protein
MAKVAAYIDGFNLYYGMKTKFARRYLWLDVVDLVHRLRPDDEVVAVRSYEEKETDVALASAMVADAALGVAEVTLLVSADSDFAPAIRAVKQVRPEQQAILALPPGNPKPHKRFMDLGYFSINETALRRSQLPEVIRDPRTRAERRRPLKWI